MKFLIALFYVLVSALSAEAVTYFNPPVHTLANGTTANASDVNGNFTGIISDGNTAAANLLAQIAGFTTGVPVGAVMMWTTANCPTGWREADGGSGSPDLRGKYIRGLGTGAGGTSAGLGVYVPDSFQDHSHAPGRPNYDSAFNTLTAGRAAGTFFSAITSFTSVGPGNTGLMSSGNIGTETRPYSYVMNYCYQNGGSTGGAGATPFSQPPVILPKTVVPSAADMMTNYNRIISDGNTAFAAYQTAINNATGASAPSGVVVPFNLSSCPTGWLASDGTHGTVDLRGSFVRLWQQSGSFLGTFSPMSLQDHTVGFGVTAGFGAGTNSTKFSGGGVSTYGAVSSFGGVGTSASGNFGIETVPKHIPLLYCQKS
jgi:hypothetical protein